MSLRQQVMLVLSLLAVMPNIAIILVFVLPNLPAMSPSLWLAIILWLFIVSALSLLIANYLSNQLLEPVNQLIKQINLLRLRPENLGQNQINLEKSPKELTSLSHAFNDLLQRISLEQSRRSAFTATLMHDLKTPLVAMNHLLAVIRDEHGLGREERIILIGRLIQENQGLIELIQKLVEAHKFEQKNIKLNKTESNLVLLAQRVFERVRLLAEERRIELRLQGKGSAVIDAKEFERALYNLLSNAVRYAGSYVQVELFPSLIRLSDDGPGLPAPLESLSEPFNHQPITIAGKNFSAGTSGLGLFIAKSIIEAHEGRLVLENSSSQGTVFLIYLSAQGK
ncbi:MAG: ATP-binding protein [Deinococcales bacterium]